jgi:uncharacterized protein YkwD
MDTVHDVLHALINHLVPHEGNDFKPQILQKTAVLLMLVLIILTFLLAQAQTRLWIASDWLIGAVLPAVVVDLTNSERSGLSLLPLERNLVLDAAAKLKAEDMARNSYFSHNSPTGITPWHWFKEAGYPFVYAGENLAVYFTDSSEVVEAWMLSPLHRANIVDNKYREIGVGTAKGKFEGYDTVFVVQLFGAPAISSPVSMADEEPILDDTAILAQVTPDVTSANLSDVGAIPQVAGESVESVVVPSTEIKEVIDMNIGNTRTLVAMTDQTSPKLENVMPEEADIMLTEVASENLAEVVSLGTVSSSSDLEPAPVLSMSEAEVPIPRSAAMATSPQSFLQWVYLILGAVTGLALTSSVVLAWRQHKVRQIMVGVALLLVMSGLFYLHNVLTLSVQIV